MPTVSTAKISSDVLVIGGGAAGMMAAVRAAEQGADVTLAEKNEKLGKKIYITGKGRCNFTNVCEIDEFLKHVPRNGRFLYSALHACAPADMIRFLEEAGCPVKIERGRRAFPVSDKASDVTKALKKRLDENRVQVLLNKEVTKIFRDESSGRFEISFAGGDRATCGKLIIATGGLSYPSTGSTGDGHRFAAECGHTVVPCSPSLTGIETQETWPQLLQGISLRNVTLTLQSGKKSLFSNQGEMLFTHYGISGPLVLEASSLLSGTDMEGKTLSIDLKPAVPTERLEADLIGRISQNGKKRIGSVLSEMLPHKMAGPFLTEVCGIDPETNCAQMSSDKRKQIVSSLKDAKLTPVSLRSFAEAIITRGGVSVKDIDPRTMESKRVPGLYFAGEVIDVDAFTGGYNLQIAFATGTLAGLSAANQAQ